MEIPHCELEREHYKALTNPLYQLEGMMDYVWEEMSGYLPYSQGQSDAGNVQPESIVKPRAIYFKNDIRALELNRRVTELENSNHYLLKKIKELTAYVSKRRRHYLYE